MAMTIRERVAEDSALLTALGISVEWLHETPEPSGTPGSAQQQPASDWTLVLTVDALRVNAGGMCHGGFLFALADTACAYALGDAGFVPATVDANITYLKPALLHDKVEAVVDIIRLGRRQGVVEVRLQRVGTGALLSVFRAPAQMSADL